MNFSEFTQNNIKSYKLQFNPVSHFVIFALIGISTVFLGIFYICASYSINSLEIHYYGESQNLQVIFNIPNKITAPVYVFYSISNFHQNHKRFANSRFYKNYYFNGIF